MRWMFTIVVLLMVTPVLAQVNAVPLPRPRPDAPPLEKPIAPTPVDASKSTGAAEKLQKPPRIYQTACPAVLAGVLDAEILPPIENDQCGLQSPYRVRGFTIGGTKVALSRPIVVNCQMATELRNWVGRISAYTQSVFKADVTQILTGTSYMCRPRNNSPGADISEHGLGNALDVRGFVLENGQRITLPDNWSEDGFAARTMRFAHDAACGHFTTVLGPEANELHADHLHVDLGCHGKTCTYRLCE